LYNIKVITELKAIHNDLQENDKMGRYNMNDLSNNPLWLKIIFSY